MNEQEKLLIPTENTESPKRRRKLLTDPERMFARCQSCQEPGNLENMLRKQIPIKDARGVELYWAFNYLYFCSDSCQGLFG